MITFTDLVALMLTFFVMLFAMSTLETQKWQSLVDSLAENLSAVGERPVAVPQADFDMPAESPPPGTDLDYVAGLLREQLPAMPSLDAAELLRADDRLLISLPADLLFAPDGVELAGDAAPAQALGAAMRNLPNRIEVAAHGAPGRPDASPWELSLLRARAVAAALARAGYDGPVAALGYGEGRSRALPQSWSPQRRRRFARRVDLVIHDTAREAPR